MYFYSFWAHRCPSPFHQSLSHSLVLLRMYLHTFETLAFTHNSRPSTRTSPPSGPPVSLPLREGGPPRPGVTGAEVPRKDLDATRRTPREGPRGSRETDSLRLRGGSKLIVPHPLSVPTVLDIGGHNPRVGPIHYAGTVEYPRSAVGLSHTDSDPLNPVRGVCGTLGLHLVPVHRRRPGPPSGGGWNNALDGR